MEKRNSIVFWITICGFFGGLFLAQNLMKQQGSDLLPGRGGDFTLMSNNGSVSLSQFKGKVTAIYFGYMSCPDICPTSLWNLSAAMKLLTPEQAAQVQGVFISVDPDRDSPHALGLFVKGFFGAFIGLTGTKDEIDKTARQYSVIYEKVPLKDSAMGYVIDHTSVIYLVDKQGVLQYYIPHNTPPQQIQADLLKLL